MVFFFPLPWILILKDFLKVSLETGDDMRVHSRSSSPAEDNGNVLRFQRPCKSTDADDSDFGVL